MVFNDNDDDVASNNFNSRNEDQKMIATVTIKNVFLLRYILYACNKGEGTGEHSHCNQLWVN